MIVKLHGNSGSGKTTLARMLMKLGETTPMGPNPRRPEAYCVSGALPSRLFILGPYTNTCGGLDSLGTWREAADLLHKYADMGHVFYEGLLSSTYYGSFGAETEQYGSNHIFAFLDTPLELCIERIKARRAAAGDTRPFNEDNTRNRVNPIANTGRRAIMKGRRVVVIRHDDQPLKQLLELYR